MPKPKSSLFALAVIAFMATSPLIAEEIEGTTIYVDEISSEGETLTSIAIETKRELQKLLQLGASLKSSKTPSAEQKIRSQSRKDTRTQTVSEHQDP